MDEVETWKWESGLCKQEVWSEIAMYLSGNCSQWAE